MLARLEDELPHGNYIYEPKWDGFRAIVFRDGAELVLQSRNEKPLNRYFPELVAGLKRVLPRKCVLDGEIVITGANGLDFDALLQRIHPAVSRINKLAEETPSSFVAFDLLALGERDLKELPLGERRALLEKRLKPQPPLFISPRTDDRALAEKWFKRFEGAGFDGIVAKDVSLPYVSDERVMIKVKHARTADCVIGGYRTNKDGLASLLLGLFDAHGVLQHVGVATGLNRARKAELLQTLAPLRDPTNHPWHDPATERVPGAPSRWSNERSTAWIAVAPERVVEVAYDHLQGERFRHATRFVRLRPDRDASSCTYEQLETPAPAELREVFAL